MMEIQTTEEDVLKLIEQQDGPITFRDLMIGLPDSVDTQSVWDTLRRLQKAMIIEDLAFRIENRKRRWRLQHWYTAKMERH